MVVMKKIWNKKKNGDSLSVEPHNCIHNNKRLIACFLLGLTKRNQNIIKYN
jgi:hypothetical protein